MNRHLLFAVLLFRIGTAWSDCPNIRLDQGEGAVAPIPVYDQEDHDICYAIVASQLADAWRFSDPAADRRQLTSFLATSAFFSGRFRASLNKRPGVTKTDGVDLGTIFDALIVLREKGACDQNRLLNQPQTGIGSELGKLSFLLKAIQPRIKSQDSSAMDFTCAKMQDAGFSKNIYPLQEDLDGIFAQPEFYASLDRFLTSVCKPISIPLANMPDPKNVVLATKQKSDEKIQGFLAALGESLGSSKPQPLGINFCRQVIFPQGDGLVASTICTPHSSLIVGSRPAGGGGCMVLVRETEGPHCNPKNRSPWECEKQNPGQYWVPLEKIAPRTFDLVYLKTAGN